MAWPGLVVAWPGLVKAWPGLVIAWPGLGMAWPDLGMAWPGLAISWGGWENVRAIKNFKICPPVVRWEVGYEGRSFQKKLEF